MKVYQAINRVQAALVRVGISKGQKNVQQSYMFRGIDDVYNSLSPLLAAEGLCILPRMLAREVVERQTKSGTALFYVTVEAEFDMVCAEDGSKHTIRTFGEAMDSGDKATNKAMSAAYKYAAFQAFAIPTEGDNDADASTHEVAAQPTPVTQPSDVDLARKQAAFAVAFAKCSESVTYIKERIAADDLRAAAGEWRALGRDDQIALWLAPTKGGCFTTAEREALKNIHSKEH